MAELTDEMTAAMSAVRHLGSSQVIEAADSLFVAIVVDAENYAQKLMEIGPQLVEATGEDAVLLEEELEDTQSAVQLAEARKAFEEAARKELGQALGIEEVAIATAETAARWPGSMPMPELAASIAWASRGAAHQEIEHTSD